LPRSNNTIEDRGRKGTTSSYQKLKFGYVNCVAHVIQMDVIQMHEKPGALRTPGNMIITMGYGPRRCRRLAPGFVTAAVPQAPTPLRPSAN